MSYPEVKITDEEYQRQLDIAKKYQDLTKKIIKDHDDAIIALKMKGMFTKAERDRLNTIKQEKIAALGAEHYKELHGEQAPDWHKFV